MIKEGRELAAIAPNITVKLPMTPEGLKACSVFSAEGIKTNVTLIFSANQALLAARAGATYVSPFFGRLDDIGHDGMELIETISDIFTIHDNGYRNYCCFHQTSTAYYRCSTYMVHIFLQLHLKYLKQSI